MTAIIMDRTRGAFKRRPEASTAVSERTLIIRFIQPSTNWSD